MIDIDKILNVKPKIKFKMIIPKQCWDYLNVFDENETNQLPSIRGKKNKPRNRIVGKGKKETNGPLVPVIQYVKEKIPGIEKNTGRIFG